MIPKECKRLAEVDFPIAVVSEYLARFPWHEVAKVQHYWPDVSAMTRPMQLGGDLPPYGANRR